MSSLKDDVAELKAEMALEDCRKLVELFGGKSRPPMSFEQQASAVEAILRGCTRAADGGSADVTVYMKIDAPLLADLALTALRLRKLAPFEDAIRDMVTGQ